MSEIGPTDKLFVVVRADLEPGQQAVQSAHALVEFIAEHAETAKEWRARSNFLALLSVANEVDLKDVARRALERGVRVSAFHEPDLGGALTAIALEPAAKRVVARLPLALASESLAR